MMTMNPVQEDSVRKQRTRRMAIGLGVLAIAFYIGFILMSVFVYSNPTP
ncbi:MAG: hypothetical protein H6981_02750 [Gammaproteobacteria bacterium]|nr:hypothetical protein [Gammaproteobacteria bacterium]MCP5135709.1 hypothetical protein [Gammaproteobacteria bacterium]